MGFLADAKTLKTPEELWNIMSNNIQLLCKLNGVTLSALAKELNLGASYFTRPRSDMPLSKAVAIGDLLGVSPEKLWDETYTADIRRRTIDAEIERLQEARRMLEEE